MILLNKIYKEGNYFFALCLSISFAYKNGIAIIGKNITQIPEIKISNKQLENNKAVLNKIKINFILMLLIFLIRFHSSIQDYQ